jgi:VPDSG-CTERM motif
MISKTFPRLLITAALILLAPLARATYIDFDPANSDVHNGKYTFTATDGHSSLDGSWVVFKNDIIVNWSLNDIHAQDTSPYPPNNLPLTPANSQHDPSNPYTGTYGADQWFFRIVGTADPSVYYYDFFQGSNNLEGPGAGGAVGRLYDGFGDPQGDWMYTQTPVPDTGSTVGLFTAALTAVGAARRLLARPKA